MFNIGRFGGSTNDSSNDDSNGNNNNDNEPIFGLITDVEASNVIKCMGYEDMNIYSISETEHRNMTNNIKSYTDPKNKNIKQRFDVIRKSYFDYGFDMPVDLVWHNFFKLNEEHITHFEKKVLNEQIKRMAIPDGIISNYSFDNNSEISKILFWLPGYEDNRIKLSDKENKFMKDKNKIINDKIRINIEENDNKNNNNDGNDDIILDMLIWDKLGFIIEKVFWKKLDIY